MSVRWMQTALAALGLLIALTCAASAQPDRYRMVGMPCRLCHMHPAGGPDLTPIGQHYLYRHPASRGHLLVGAPGIGRHPGENAVREEWAADGGAAGLLAVGFGIISFCLLAYRKSRLD